jgi:transcriptional regulator with XRE-family HTH domain
MISTRQVKAARALLAWSQRDLAEKAGLPDSAVARIEEGDGPLLEANGEEARLLAALRKAGVAFMEEDGGGAGVKVRPTRRDEGLRPEQLTTDNDG